MIGLEHPRVYNTDDLETTNRWPVIYRVMKDGKKLRIPYHHMDGSRDEYYKYDFIFVENGVFWRRMMGKLDLKYSVVDLNHPRSLPFQILKRVIGFDFRLEGMPVTISHYEIEYYESLGSKRSLPPNERYKVRFIGKTKVDHNNFAASPRAFPLSYIYR